MIKNLICFIIIQLIVKYKYFCNYINNNYELYSKKEIHVFTKNNKNVDI